ncbi:alpha-E domain-containing protein [Acinetobacter shaoyimingii]|uniref:Alpha-E domain-containing protein n=1 Tax=Acinetobacter shaoyimingii TaxID=2715164 RepID=A0A6G8RWE1_9GAMM|nr:alpha-E domain-containing protein [Acinetobacter shaoyimingii]QIO06259.1 alpha-E domain-containing protein [Acinetobacter shaoyimingii]
MILLTSNVQNIFWVGKYLTRVQYLCGQFPFQNDEQAMTYAHAFCLPAFDASSLNELVLNPEQPASFHQQFQCVKNNIHDLRGILSMQTYSAMKKMIDAADKNAGYICTVVDECSEVLEAENEDIFLFYSLGELMEKLDHQIRLNQSYTDTVEKMDGLIELLNQYGWNDLNEKWAEFKAEPNFNNFYQLNDQVQSFFEADV